MDEPPPTPQHISRTPSNAAASLVDKLTLELDPRRDPGAASLGLAHATSTTSSTSATSITSSKSKGELAGGGTSGGAAYANADKPLQRRRDEAPNLANAQVWFRSIRV